MSDGGNEPTDDFQAKPTVGLEKSNYSGGFRHFETYYFPNCDFADVNPENTEHI